MPTRKIKVSFLYRDPDATCEALVTTTHDTRSEFCDFATMSRVFLQKHKTCIMSATKATKESTVMAMETDASYSQDDGTPFSAYEWTKWIVIKIIMLVVGIHVALFLYIVGAFSVFALDDPNAPKIAEVFVTIWILVFWSLATAVLGGTIAAVVTHNGIWMVPCLWPNRISCLRRRANNESNNDEVGNQTIEGERLV